MIGGLRRIVCSLSVLVLSVGLVGTASASAAAPDAARAAFSGPTIELSVSRDDVSAAAISCGVSVGNDVTIYDGHLNVTWAITCRDTATGRVSDLVRDITMVIGIRKGTSFIAPISKPCVTPGPSATCFHRVLYDGFTGRVDSVMSAKVTWTDGYRDLTGTFLSPGSTIT
jgi:hypothetical protein